jgi:hypothetical protein
MKAVSWAPRIGTNRMRRRNATTNRPTISNVASNRLTPARCRLLATGSSR